MAFPLRSHAPADDLASLQQLLPSTTLAVFSVDADREALVLNRVLGPAAVRLRDLTIDIGFQVSGWVAANWVPMINADAQLDLDLRAEELRYALSMPLIADNRLAGVLTLYSTEPFGDVVLQRVEVLMPVLAANVASHEDSPTVGPHRLLRLAARH
jgi:hypothetical protein